MKFELKKIKNSQKLDIKKKILAVIVISIIFAGASVVMNEKGKEKTTTLTRPQPGETDEIRQINVLDKSGGLLAQLDIDVEPRQLSEKEAFEYFEKAYQETMRTMLGNNESIGHVTSDLNLCETAQNGIIELEWYSTDYELVGYDGKVNNRGFSENEEREVKLVLITRYGEYRNEYDVRVNVAAPEYDAQTQIKVHAQESIKKAADSSPQSPDIVLPEYIDGQAVDYEPAGGTSSPSLYIVLGMVSVVLIVLMEKRKGKDLLKKRKKELIYDYSEIVSKLTLLLGAGMTTRMAWHKIAADYNEKRQSGSIDARPAYDEMYEADCNMQAGISEAAAYERFGKRCDTREYMKLASLLQTNIKKGTSQLRLLLEQEVNESFEKRKNMAKVKGEEATTKLLFPMLLMLGVVMAIIMIPAVMQFNM